MKELKRVLIKLSGEALADGKGNVYDFSKLDSMAKQIGQMVSCGIETAVVIGGGNIWRGRSGGDMNRAQADSMGMLATAINSLALEEALERKGVPSVVLSAVDMPKFAELFNRKRAVEHLEQGHVAIFACGTGNPYFSTDTAAVLRALEIEADAILMAKNVDGVYDKDPRKHADAKKFLHITYKEMFEKQLNAIDITAATLCMEHDLDTFIFALDSNGSIYDTVKDNSNGTFITKE